MNHKLLGKKIHDHKQKNDHGDHLEGGPDGVGIRNFKHGNGVFC